MEQKSIGDGNSEDVKNTEQSEVKCMVNDDLDTLPWRFVDLLTNVKVEIIEGDSKHDVRSSSSSFERNSTKYKLNDIEQRIKKEDEQSNISFDFGRPSTIDPDELKIIPPTGDASVTKQQNGYQCNHCGRCFQNNDDTQVDSNNKCFICNRCKKSFSEFIAHNIHLINNKERRINVQNYACNTCNKSFTSKIVLKHHLLKHSIIIDFVCKDCGKCFNNVPSLQHSKYLLKGVKKYKCNEYEIADKSSFEIHLIIHVCIKKHRCRECGKIFRRKSSVSKHCLKHKGHKSHKCQLCKKCFPTLKNLKIHMTTHEDIMQFKCDECEKCFTSKQGLKLHVIRHIKKSNFECGICRKHFVYKRCFVSHCSMHGLNHKCDVCGKCFVDEDTLKTHLTSHENVKNYVCHCGKTFVRKTCFISHSSKHGILYKCHDCENCFSDKQSLKAHIRNHKSNNSSVHKLDYKCNKCKQCFFDKHKFEAHIMSHKSGKKFVCHCGKAFVYKACFISHSSMHNQFKCDECKECFIDKQSFEAHIITHKIDKSSIRDVDSKCDEHEECVTDQQSFETNSMSDKSNKAVPDQNYKCDECKEYFTDKESLEAHMMTHKINKKFIGHCGKAFRQKNHYKSHSSKHNVKYNCDECQKCYTDKVRLDKHMMMTHKNDKKCVCQCGKSFVHEDQFISHFAVHNSQYKCIECNECFSDKHKYESHIMGHKSGKKFMCHCGKAFVYKARFISHSSMHNQFKCDHCKEFFTNKESFEVHIMTHKINKSLIHDVDSKHDKPEECFTDKQNLSDKSNKSVVQNQNYKCDECKDSFADKQTLEAHMMAHKINKKYICHCGKAFQRKKNYISHSSKHNIKYKCDECQKCYTSKPRLKRHMMTHKNNKKYSLQCGKSFAHEDQYICHSDIQSTQYKCNECKKCFSDKRKFEAHSMSHKSIKPSVHDVNYKCVKCKECFSDKLTFEAHVMSHRKDKKFVCHCGKSFVHEARYISHSAVHSRQYKCDECDNCFLDKYSLRTHIKTNKSNKKYVCHCGRAFVQKGRFISHSSKHNIQYKCNKCQTCFTDKKFLKVHLLKSHKNVINYVCNICGKVFVHEKRFISHTSVHKIQYKCGICKKCFASKSALRKHASVHK